MASADRRDDGRQCESTGRNRRSSYRVRLAGRAGDLHQRHRFSQSRRQRRSACRHRLLSAWIAVDRRRHSSLGPDARLYGAGRDGEPSRVSVTPSSSPFSFRHCPAKMRSQEELLPDREAKPFDKASRKSEWWGRGFVPPSRTNPHVTSTLRLAYPLASCVPAELASISASGSKLAHPEVLLNGS